MRGSDLIGLALSGFRQSKTRTGLTLAGVLLGTTMFAVSVSLGHGLRQYTYESFHKDDGLRTIFARDGFRSPSVDESAIPTAEIALPDTVGPARRQRLRKHLVRRWQERQPSRPVPLTPARLAAVARLDHVITVRPEVYEPVEVTSGANAATTRLETLPPGTNSLAARLVTGRLPAPDRPELLISERQLFDWGVVADADVERFVGRTVRLTAKNDDRAAPYQLLWLLGAGGVQPAPDELQALSQLAERLPTALDRLDLPPAQSALIKSLLARNSTNQPAQRPQRVAADYKVVGVHYQPEPTPDDCLRPAAGWRDIVAPVGPVQELLTGLPRYAERGYEAVDVTVDEEVHVRAVVEELHRMGLWTNAAVEWAERVYQEVTLIGAGMTVLSTLALVVAGLGITNTMATSVLERTRDIGVMKAVGARDRHVLGLFLLEGASIGLTGGLLGLLAAWLLSFPAENWIRGIIEHQAQHKVTGAIFRFPPWLVTAVPIFAVLVTTAAAALPARRAAAIDPAVTLRTE